jgi:hypothetical protein
MKLLAPCYLFWLKETTECMKYTNANNTFPENNNIHVNRRQIILAISVLLESPIIDEIIVAEQFDFLSRFLHHYVF